MSRNKQLDGSGKYSAMVILLVGVEMATDKSGLQDFYRVVPHTLWNAQLRSSFAPLD
ncbi:hypothetical protein [Desulfobacter latus]|uniref:Uncharacterized protein n=1 Tax=Desulfobacter latus TaxID=2292 RepID=A0A850T959_9BACT|nr:hypothetical protein [Desulfobacter latus]NWH04737.1 hypothetical protein [Desulfobacter latus]